MDPHPDELRAAGLPPIQRQRPQVQDQGTAQALNRLHFQAGNNTQLRLQTQRLPTSSALTAIEREQDIGMYLREQLNYRHEFELRQRVMNERELVVDLLTARQGNDIPSAALQRQQAINLQRSRGGIFLPDGQLDRQIGLRAAAQQQQFDLLRRQQMQEYLRRQNNSSPSDQPSQRRKRSQSVVSNGSKKDNHGTGGRKKQKNSNDAQGTSENRVEKIFVNSEKQNGKIDAETKEGDPGKQSNTHNSIDLTIDEDVWPVDSSEERTDSIMIDHGTKGVSGSDGPTNDVSTATSSTSTDVGKKMSILLQALQDLQTEIPTASNAEVSESATLAGGVDILAEVSTELETSKPEEKVNSNYPVTFSDEEAVTIVQNLKHVPAKSSDLPKDIEYISPKSSDLPKDTEQDEEREELFPGFVAVLPKLPFEPNFSEEDHRGSAGESSDGNLAEKLLSADIPPTEAPTGPIFLQPPKRKPESKHTNYSSVGDTWWPSNSSLRRERRWQGYDSDIENQDGKAEHGVIKTPDKGTICISSSMHERLSNHIEPGALEKLPHCKVHEKGHQAQYGRKPSNCLFCCQVTETYCNSVMVCCSICSTWRHVECGGHYDRYSTKSTEEEFIPVCDRCHAEKSLLEKYPIAARRMNRQHTELIRRTEATSAIMRQLAYAKHGGTYKWPLGSVSSTHIGGHTRSVHLRHERSEKQWGDMARILSTHLGLRSRERVKARTKELERLAVNLEDAEGHTDRHNMILFLQNDTMKKYPVGFEKSRLNFFDAQEDEQAFIEDSDEGNVQKAPAPVEDVGREYYKDENTQEIWHSVETSDKEGTGLEQAYSSDTDDDRSQIPALDDDKSSSSGTSKEDSDSEEQEKTGSEQQPNHEKSRAHVNMFPVCARPCCKRRPRFDSAFCSDGCGVSTLELDVLRSLQYANEIHPYQLRL